ncbi:MAG: KamA family radical SAM protein [Desulfatiglandales bacterium]
MLEYLEPEEWMAGGIHTLKGLYDHFGIIPEPLEPVVKGYPLRISSHFLRLINHIEDPLGRQVIPSLQELERSLGEEDPLMEEAFSPIPNLTHRYPDRVLLLVSEQCASFCRFCNRRRKVGKGGVVTEETVKRGLEYIRENRSIREVLLSGGDPLLLKDRAISRILEALRAIPHVEVIRIGTRVPVFLPQRITHELVDILRQHHPLFMNIHFNHPGEISEETERAVSLLADAGIPLGSQTVLLRGVNDRPEILKGLFLNLLRLRVRPYYLFQADLVSGTSHFWTHPLRGLEIFRQLWGKISSLAIPHFAIDLPQGGGKVPVIPSFIREVTGDGISFENFEGKKVVIKNLWRTEPW